MKKGKHMALANAVMRGTKVMPRVGARTKVMTKAKMKGMKLV